MSLWLDEHLSPQLASWITEEFGIVATQIRDLGLARAKDIEIFGAARNADVIFMTKDADFVAVLERLGPPPRIIWLTCGNTSNANLKRLLQRNLRASLEAFANGEHLVEFG